MRYAWVDAGKGLAILLVVLYHAASWATRLGPEQVVWTWINEVVSTLRMPMFFMLAGLFAGKWVAGTWPELLRKKLWLFTWIFALWQIVGTVAIHTGQMLLGEPVSIGGSLKRLLLAPVFPRLELWFIWTLGIFFVLAKVTRRLDWRAQLVLAAVSSIVALWLWPNPGAWRGVAGCAKYYVFFLVGLHLADRVLSWASALRPRTGAIIAASWLALSVGIAVWGLQAWPGVAFLNCLAGVVAGIAVSRALAGSRMLRHVGARTLPVYVTHTPVVVLVVAMASLLPVSLNAWASVELAVPPVLAVLAISAALLVNQAMRDTAFKYLYEAPALAERGKARVGNDPVRGRISKGET